MTDNERLFAAYDFLKEKGLVKTYIELSEALKTNKAGINDLKTGKKKVSVENFRSMIKSYPILSLHWLILEEGSIEEVGKITDTSFNISSELLIMQKKEIARLERELAKLREKD
ncbi:hypothetical protein [Flavobacterium sp.]|uniref:hypothetical protein n=1 Tax=Flavobacterium sp. TaxID=239 RepID=UPI002623501F|nr:hypothetical protein [Flavobacterium sp.]